MNRRPRFPLLYLDLPIRAIRALLFVSVCLRPAWPADPARRSDPVLEMLRATMNVGAGREPSLGVGPAVPTLEGVVRVEGLDRRRSSFRITALAPAGNGGKPVAHRLDPSSWRAPDPNDPALIRWTAAWTRPELPEGWTLRMEYLRDKRKRVASGPIRLFFLPASGPHGPRPENEK